MNDKATAPSSRLTSQDPVDVKWRGDQMRASSAIEGMAESPILRKLVDDMEAQGLSLDQQIERVKAFDLGAAKKPEAGGA